jgi:L-threonylcarbamoyladenylate synthase
MQIIPLSTVNNKEIEFIADEIKKGKIAILPTDTIYGLSCDATNIAAIKKIYQIKKREKNKPLLILVDSLKMLKKYCAVNEWQEKWLTKNWLLQNGAVPITDTALRQTKKIRPTTVLLNSITSVSHDGAVLSTETAPERQGGVAVRLPQNDFLLKIIKRVGHPIISTSLNISGRPHLSSVDKIEKYFKKHKPDLIVDAGEIKNKPSRIIDLRYPKKVRVIRK